MEGFFHGLTTVRWGETNGEKQRISEKNREYQRKTEKKRDCFLWWLTSK
jgi:hypothetical protein